MRTDESLGPWTSLILMERFRDGDDLAADALFSRHFDRLIALARSQLSPRISRRTDPEDIVLSAYRSFFVGARAGRYTLGGGGDLGRVLSAITKNKLLRQVRYHRAGRRSVEAEQPLDLTDETRFAGHPAEPSPEEAAALNDELERVFLHLDSLGRRVLELRLQGHQIPEIAGQVGCSERSVRRAMAHIRGHLAGRLAIDRGNRGSEVGAGATSRSTIAPVSREQGAGDLPGEATISHRDFLLKRLIGSGHMGKVYEASEHGTGRAVAVKFLRKSLLVHRGVVRRFIEEARTIGGLSHPNIVGARGLGRTPGGSHFIVMDLVAGPILAVIGSQRAIGVEEAIRWSIEICEAIEHAHERGIVHCDLKPANLLLDEGGRIRVTDFGLARSLAGGTPWAAEIEGTAPFMAPEQVSTSWGAIDRRTDIYGIGAVLFALLTGYPPHVGRTLPEILFEVGSSTPVDSPQSVRPELPRTLCEICLRCLAKAPCDRYQTVQDIRSALTGICVHGFRRA